MPRKRYVLPYFRTIDRVREAFRAEFLRDQGCEGANVCTGAHDRLETKYRVGAYGATPEIPPLFGNIIAPEVGPEAPCIAIDFQVF